MKIIAYVPSSVATFSVLIQTSETLFINLLDVDERSLIIQRNGI